LPSRGAHAAALDIGLTRWAYVGWAPVRLARSEVPEAAIALQEAGDHGGSAIDRE